MIHDNSRAVWPCHNKWPPFHSRVVRSKSKVSDSLSVSDFWERHDAQTVRLATHFEFWERHDAQTVRLATHSDFRERQDAQTVLLATHSDFWERHDA
jgi:glycine betaine/choline ABC-type transport system substrate-binding protein